MTEATQITPMQRNLQMIANDQIKAKIAAVLPPHITVEKFERVAVLAITRNEDLGKCDSQSLLNECIACANDGLLPDDKEATILTFKSRKTGKVTAKYVPMIAGILMKIRNSGEIPTVGTGVVFHEDTWEFWVDNKGDNFEHRPDWGIDRIANTDKSNVKLIYAYATTKDGRQFVTPMTVQQIEKIRATSRAKDAGPWVDWWDEQAQVKAMRRLSKRLPMSSDMRALIEREDDLHEFPPVDTSAASGPASEQAAPAPQRESRAAARAAEVSSEGEAVSPAEAEELANASVAAAPAQAVADDKGPPEVNPKTPDAPTDDNIPI